MIKYPRFIIEYANYKIDAIQNYNTFSESVNAWESPGSLVAALPRSAPFCAVLRFLRVLRLSAKFRKEV